MWCVGLALLLVRRAAAQHRSPNVRIGMLRGLLFASTILLAGCGSSPVDRQPTKTEIAGTYTAQLPNGLVSTVTVGSNGEITGSNVPERSLSSDDINYRRVQSTWRFTDPSMTPSGFWSIEFDGMFFSIYSSGGKFFLHHSYDVLHAEAAIYAKPS